MWKRLTSKLNEIGPAVKTESQWIKTWTSLRLSAKGKVCTFLKSHNKTGNNAPKENVTEEDLQITNIFGKYGTGVAVTKELEFMHIKMEKKSVNAVDVSNHLPAQFIDIKTNIRPTVSQLNYLIDSMEDSYSQSFNIAMTDAESVTKITPQLNARGNEANKKDSFSWIRTWNNLLGNAKKNSNLSREEQRNLPEYHKKAIEFYIKYKLSDPLTNKENNCNVVNSAPVNCTVPCTEAPISLQHLQNNFQKSCPSSQTAVPSQKMYMFQQQQLPRTLESPRTPVHLSNNFQQSSSQSASHRSVPLQQMYALQSQPSLQQLELPRTSPKSFSRNDTLSRQCYVSEQKLQEMLMNLSDDEVLSDEEIHTADMADESVDCNMNFAKKQRVEVSKRAHAVDELPTFDKMHTQFLSNLQNTVIKTMNEKIETDIINDVVRNIRKEFDEKFINLKTDIIKMMDERMKEMQREMKNYVDAETTKITTNVATLFNDFVIHH
ncbi:uncharacterized protein LOC100679679 isoform X1 [Nasonia vitripennis]|uniref:Regulatory protein zeste n=1 Tax=Nasonia vitripennis TaxID=7425 RepID=A0A7M7R276_NASVI|nr:uncharacterized protein LOC100679679 isoform X1 [Nasonia vitripennis]XP_016842863.1 uncharacterized protein LOC100679679 isoform X1 [Nasonia vitripennis]XP_032457200.1 uncharacterized protein LOC100679679 isoform X1 [Nasonia vitripennis]XP_032457201.1 uncharacterized protein LOC100679679 isoform X1 [Nasonia vitripennis]XP_032457202.1 uncharacterized protein LOC100679679 isoform X1 [Nasonia vitripennis]XP_032457203.1 uncharacterized protein LOC100679679 isoform X1 [Nasonia vitripennis]XP_03